MKALSGAGLWLALLGTAWGTGVLGTQWNGGAGSGALRRPHIVESVQMVVTALIVVAWGTLGGSVLRGDMSLALMVEGVPIDVPVGYRVAALWATGRGALLTAALGMSFLTLAAPSLARGAGSPNTKLTAGFSGLSLLALAVSLAIRPPFAPADQATEISGVAPFLLHPAAAVAPLLALCSAVLTVAVLGTSLTSPAAVAVDGRLTTPAAAVDGRLTTAAWLLATLALAAEQAARSDLGLRPRDPVVFGGGASGLVLWGLTSALLHRQVIGFLRRARRAVTPRPSGRWGLHLAHAGAALAVISFAGHAFAKRVETSLPPGRSGEVRDALGRQWRLVNQGVSSFDAPGREVTAVALEVTAPGGRTRLLTTELRHYQDRTGAARGDPIGVRASWPGVGQDFRVVLAEAGEGEVAHVRVSFVPLALLWPVGVALMLGAGAVLVMGPRRAATAGGAE